MASGNGISGLLNFKIFQTPLDTGVSGAPLACPTAHKFLATAMLTTAAWVGAREPIVESCQ